MCRQCNCDSSNTTCQCGNGSREHLLSITAKFTTISAIIASPDGVLNIADQVYDLLVRYMLNINLTVQYLI